MVIGWHHVNRRFFREQRECERCRQREGMKTSQRNSRATLLFSTSFCLVFTCKYLLERLIGHEIQNEHVKLSRNWINRIFCSFQLHHHTVCTFINDMLLCVKVSDTYVHYGFVVCHFFCIRHYCTIYLSAVCFVLFFFASFTCEEFRLRVFHKFNTIKHLTWSHNSTHEHMKHSCCRHLINLLFCIALQFLILAHGIAESNQ